MPITSQNATRQFDHAFRGLTFLTVSKDSYLIFNDAPQSKTSVTGSSEVGYLLSFPIGLPAHSSTVFRNTFTRDAQIVNALVSLR